MIDRSEFARRAVLGLRPKETDTEHELRLDTMFVDAYTKHREDRADDIEREAIKQAEILKQRDAIHQAETVVKRDAETVAYLASELGQRDQWVYEQRTEGHGNRQVIDDLGRVFFERSWEHLTTSQGIRDAVKRYCLRTGAPPLTGNKGGRPSRGNRKGQTAK